MLHLSIIKHMSAGRQVKKNNTFFIPRTPLSHTKQANHRQSNVHSHLSHSLQQHASQHELNQAEKNDFDPKSTAPMEPETLRPSEEKLEPTERLEKAKTPGCGKQRK